MVALNYCILMFGASILHLPFRVVVFFLTIADDFSRSGWVCLLKHKNEVGEYLINFHNIVKTQFENQNIKSRQ